MGSELLDYFNGDELAASVWQGKYALEGESTPDDMHKRMAKEFARVEEGYILVEGRNALTLSKYGHKRTHLDENKIYNFFKDFKYIIPQGSIMSQLGSPQIGSLSNCFVVGQPEDSYGGIFQKEEQMIQLMKRRGGVGIDLSTLRPEGTNTTNAARTSTGAVSFMHRFSNGTREVAQQGRRGALMISMDINHPDVMEFIKIKRDLTQVTGANISIKLNDEFMDAVQNNSAYVLRFPCTEDTKWGLIEGGQNGQFTLFGQSKEDRLEIDNPEYNKAYTQGNLTIKLVSAREYWDEIIKSAHGVAEPGLMFWDTMTGYSPDGIYPQFKQVTTNPCSEIGMQPYDACRLMAVNLYSFVDNPWTPEATFNWKKFYEYNYEAMRLSDDLIDLELEHIDRILDKIESDPESDEVKMREYDLWHKIRETATASRRTGLGFTALADTIAALDMKYDSDEAILFVEAIMQTKMRSELDCTTDLAILRGTFEGWDRDTEFLISESNTGTAIDGRNDFYNFLLTTFPEQASRMVKYGRRNVSWSTVAPTGSLSIMAKLNTYSNVSSGMEPVFMPYYMRRKKVNANDVNARVDFTDQNGDTWQEYPVIMAGFKEWMNKTWDYNEVMGDHTTKENLQAAFEQSPYYGSTANDINWVKRVKMQSIIQKYVTHSISSTINLPETVTEAEVSTIYLESWRQNLKGITVYRDGSRSGVLVSESNKSREEFNYIDATKRPKELPGEVHTTKVGGVNYVVFVGLLHGKPYEVFIDAGTYTPSKGTITKNRKGEYSYSIDGIVSVPISSEMTDEQSAITRLVSTSLRHGADIKFIVEQINKCDGDLFSFTKGLARVLKKYIPDGAKSTVKCNDCGSENVIFEEGCNKCLECGSSKCG